LTFGNFLGKKVKKSPMCNPHDASTFGKKTLPTTSSPTSMIVSSSKLKAPPPLSSKNSWVMFLLLQASPSW
jgi:hypothetical protein